MKKIVFSVLNMVALVTMIFLVIERGIPDINESLFWIWSLFMVTFTLNLYYLFVGDSKNLGPFILISRWIERKILEEEERIRVLRKNREK